MPAEPDHPIQNKAKHSIKVMDQRNKALLALFPAAGDIRNKTAGNSENGMIRENTDGTA
jgi:hypothetical protein